MLDFHIPAISCDHCVRAVTEAVHKVDPGARVQVDLASQQVHVQTSAARAAVRAELVDAGYTPD